MPEEIADCFRWRHLKELEDLLVPKNLHGKDPRAEYSPESFSIREVAQEGPGQYRMFYEYGWYAHYGCRDMAHGDIECEEISFRYRKGEALFEFELPEERTTVDEF